MSSITEAKTFWYSNKKKSATGEGGRKEFQNEKSFAKENRFWDIWMVGTNFWREKKLFDNIM